LTSKYYYNGKAVASDAILFTYDGDSTADQKANEDNYGVTTVAKAAGKDLEASYLLDSGKITVMLIDGLGVSDEDIFGVVTSRAKTTASSTDYQLTLLVDGEEVVYDVIKAVYDKFYDGNLEADPIVPHTYDYLTVYKLKLNTNDAISGLTAASGDEIILGSWTKATEYSNNVVKAGSEYTVDTSGVAYVLNSDGTGFELSKINKSNLLNNEIKLFDTDEDGVADLVLIKEL